MPFMSKRILRLLEDYTPDPPATSQEKYCRKDLLLEVGNRKDGWVMVKQLDCYDSVPGWVPQRLVTKATPGFYRLRKDMELRFGIKVARGHMLKVSDGKFTFAENPEFADRMEAKYGILPWEVDLLDGSGIVHWVSPLDLEPATDVVLEPPSSTGPSRTFFGSMLRGRKHTVGAAEKGAPPPYHQDATDKPGYE